MIHDNTKSINVLIPCIADQELTLPLCEEIIKALYSEQQLAEHNDEGITHTYEGPSITLFTKEEPNSITIVRYATAAWHANNMTDQKKNRRPDCRAFFVWWQSIAMRLWSNYIDTIIFALSIAWKR